ncbi:MAG: bifunctional UDP-sugar hydrolase/5'-nucleotidase [Halorientalis sp.]
MPPRVVHYSDLENVFDHPERAGRLAGLVDSLRTPEALVLGSGDNTAPGVTSMVHEGAQALDFFATVGPDADTFGNHDFDYGAGTLLETVERSPQVWVSANVRRGDEPFGRDAGVVPSTVLERGGHAVGLVGVTDPATGAMSPGASDLTFTDPVDAVRREAATLRDRDVDAVVVLSHLGAGDQDLARRTDVDAILGGHVHDERVAEVDGTLLARTGANGHRVLTADLGTKDVTVHDVAEGAVDEAVRDALVRRREAAGLDEVVATVADPVRRGSDLTGAGECRIGNFVADAYRWAADADVGLHNTGGLREGPPLEGAVTVADLASVVPFDEPVAVAEVTGAQLRAILRQGDGRTLQSSTDRWLAHVSGVRVRRRDEETEVALEKGEIDEAATYRLATSEFLLHTDREFPALDESDRVATLATQYEVLADYAREHGIDPAVEGRIRGVAPAPDSKG